MTWPFLIGPKANGFPLDKSLKSKKQKQQQRIRKEKPQQHNFTHRLLAAALKVHGYHAQHTYRFFLCSILCLLLNPWSLTRVSLDATFCPFSSHPISILLLIQATVPWSHGCTLGFPICPRGSYSHFLHTFPLEPQWEHILHGL